MHGQSQLVATCIILIHFLGSETAELIEDDARPHSCKAYMNVSLGLDISNGKALDWKVTLKNGLQMPRIGFGTYLTSGKDCSSAVETALKAGYRHIDTARLYQNEKDVRKGIEASGVPRSEIFITSKIPPWQQGRRNKT